MADAVRAHNLAVLASLHVRRPVPATARAIADRWTDPLCDACDDEGEDGHLACPNWVADAGAVVEVICTFRASPQLFVYVEVPHDATTDEVFVRTVLSRLSAPLAADLVKLSCMPLTIVDDALPFLDAPTHGKFYFNSERNTDPETRRWQAFLTAYLAEARPRTRALVSLTGAAGADEAETRAILAWFQAAGATAALSCTPSKPSLVPQPGPGCFRIVAFPGVPTAHHVTLCTVGFATLHASAAARRPTRADAAASDPELRHEILITVRTPKRAGDGGPPQRVVDSLYGELNMLREGLASEMATVTVGVVVRFARQNVPAPGLTGFTFQQAAATLGLPAQASTQVRPRGRQHAPIQLVAMVLVTASEMEAVMRLATTDHEAAGQRLWHQLRAAGVDLTDLARPSVALLPAGRKRVAEAAAAVTAPLPPAQRRRAAKVAALTAAAAGGDAEAMVALAALHKETDAQAKARRLFEQAAAKGHPGAQTTLALDCLSGTGGKVDGARAVALLTAAADGGGHADAAFHLGQLLVVRNDDAEAHGIQHDPVRGHRYLLRAAAQGVAAAATLVGRNYQTGVGVERADAAEAVRWYTRAHERGGLLGTVELALCYHLGRGADKDPPRAIALASEAVAKGNPMAMAVLGKIYGDLGDWAKAVPLFRRSAARGNAMATTELGYCYLRGEGVRQDQRRGRAMIARARAVETDDEEESEEDEDEEDKEEEEGED